MRFFEISPYPDSIDRYHSCFPLHPLQIPRVLEEDQADDARHAGVYEIEEGQRIERECGSTAFLKLRRISWGYQVTRVVFRFFFSIPMTVLAADGLWGGYVLNRNL
jgi:hypothetical protein